MSNPTHPGETLLIDFLVPSGMTRRELADHLGCDEQLITRIINREARVTAQMAAALADVFGTSPEFWLNAQSAVDDQRERQIEAMEKVMARHADALRKLADS